MMDNIIITNEEIINLTIAIKKKLKYYSDIPPEYRLHPEIVNTQRKLKMRKTIRKGFDIIQNNFFVEELVKYSKINGQIIEKEITNVFPDFDSYHEFLNGDIYKNACYYEYHFNEDDIKKYSINIKKINYKAFIKYDINTYNLELQSIENEKYYQVEHIKKELNQKLKMLCACKSYDQFALTLINIKHNIIAYIHSEFYIFNYIYANKETALDLIIELITNNDYAYMGFEKNLCLIYNPSDVLNAYRVSCNNKHLKNNRVQQLINFTNSLINGTINFTHDAYFDENINYFVYKRNAYSLKNGRPFKEAEDLRYFQDFNTFSEFLNYDLSDCDLSKALSLKIDISKYRINTNTKLPLHLEEYISYDIIKKFDRTTNLFTVIQHWKNRQGKLIKSYNKAFTYFFDFVYFLKNDLSNADLLFCDGLENIMDFSGLNLDNARLKSNILDKIGVKYKLIDDNFNLTNYNELENINQALCERENLYSEDILNNRKIYYITDLHLLHRYHNANCKTFYDRIYITQKIIDKCLSTIQTWENNILLIGGDTSSEFAYFKLFINLLRESLDEKKLKVNVIFTLGNHELWDFKEPKKNIQKEKTHTCTNYLDFNEIVDLYKKLILENQMYLLQNNIIYEYDDNQIGEINSNELQKLSENDLQLILNKARIILFGGLGFAGYNEEFNANNFIYKLAISRSLEIKETKKFENLYNKICNALFHKRVIIFTHMPQKNWCSNNIKIKNFVYISGHTHTNYFYDDGDIRIYSDNQIGYKQNNFTLKYFNIEDTYDLFATREDGIYEITREEYIDFYRGKRIAITFNRDFYKMFMLKRNGYYMFILQNTNKNLCILNGGASKKLTNSSIDYYYENMTETISYIKSPLDKYTEYQKQIANKIKSIGGSGYIHGAIIDIDFFNHIYVNPFDSTITAYWASDIVNKKIYKNIPSLLQKNCPQIYNNYIKLLNETGFNANNDTNVANVPVTYLSTDIYKASREIKKMQKLESNVLSIWVEKSNIKITE